MLKDLDDPRKGSAKERATRRWRNYDVERRFKEEAKKPPPRPSISKLEIADTIENEKIDHRGSLLRAQTKFAKDLKVMMEGHSKRNLALYVLSIRAQRYRLVKEKLRRLELREAQRVAQRVAQPKRDLFS
jgi:hypothetical protein